MALSKDFVVKNGLIVLGTESANSTSTTTGAITTPGGAGIGGDLWVGGTIHGIIAGSISTATNLSGGLTNQILYQTAPGATGYITAPTVSNSYLQWTNSGFTWSSFTNLITSVSAGTDTVVSTSTGDIVIWNTSTLQSVTDRGNSTNNALTITNTSASTSTNTGALTVTGGVGINGSLFAGNGITSKGNILPSGTHNLGALLTPWNLLYANSIYDTNKRVITTVTPSAGVGIAITSSSVSGPSAFFTIVNTGVTSLAGTTYIGVSSDTGTVTLTNLGVQTLTAGTDTAVSASTGTVTVWNNSTLQSVTARGATTPSAILITNTGSSALSVSGTITAGSALVNGAQVWTTATLTDNSQLTNGAEYLTSSTIGNYGVSSINGTTYIGVSASTGNVTLTNLGVQTLTAGTDTAVSRSTGTVTVWNNSTLQSITNRGSATTNALSITNNTESTSTNSGALIVSGGVGVGGNLYINGEIVAQKLTIQLTTVTTTLVVTDDQIQTYNSTQSTSTNSGALIISGGAGVGGNIYAGGIIYSNGNQLLQSITPSAGSGISVTSVSTANGNTSFTINNTGVTSLSGTSYLGVSSSTGEITLTNLGVQTAIGTTYLGVSASTGSVTFTNLGVHTLTAGTDTAVSASTGTVIVWNNSTLQSITNRGSATSNAISITNNTESTSTNSGSLIVTGGVGTGGRINSGGTIQSLTGFKAMAESGEVLVFGDDTLSSGLKIINFKSLAGIDAQIKVGSEDLYNGITTFRIHQADGTGNFDISSYSMTGGYGPSGYGLRFRINSNGDTQIFGAESTSTSNGALQVNGGVGISGNLNVGGTAKVNGAQVWTTATLQNVSSLSNDAGYLTSSTIGQYGVSSLNGTTYIGVSASTGNVTLTNLGVQTLTAGTDTAVSRSTGTVTVWNTSTLQSITNRGSITNNAVSITNTTDASSTDTGALIVSGGVGVGGTLYVASTSYVNGSRILTAVDLQTVTTTGTFITNDPTYNAGLLAVAGTSTAYGTYNFGDISSVSTFNDYNTATNSGFYSINDASGAPGYIVYIGFTNVTRFTRLVMNINYTQNSGHTVQIDLYNFQTSAWDSFTTYSGSPGWTQFILETFDCVPYISSSTTYARLNHTSAGNTAHRTWIDYAVLQDSLQGGQGPRGATGPTGAQGPQGLTTTTTSTFIFNNYTDSGSTNTGAVVVYGGVGVGGSLYVGGVVTASTFVGNLTGLATTATQLSNSITFNNSNSGDASGITFNGSTARTVSANTLGALSLAGGGIVSGNVTFSGPVTFSGTLTYVASSATVYTDNIIELHTPAGGMDDLWTVDDGKDIGFHLHYYANGTDTNAALLLRNDSKYLEWFQSGTDSLSNGNNFTATTYGTFKTGSIILANTTASNGTSTGALVVAGGVGVGGNLNVGGTAKVNGAQVWTTATLQNVSSLSNDAGYLTSSTIGQYGVSSIDGTTYIGVSASTGNVTLTNLGVQTLTAGTDTAVSASTGTITVWNTSTLQSVTHRGGVTSNAIYITNLTQATSISTGALIISGGAAVGGNIYVGEDVLVKGSVAWTTSTLHFVSSLTNDVGYITSATLGSYGVSAINAGAGISVSGNTGSVTVSNIGVLALNSGDDISLNTTTGVVIVSDKSTLQSVTNRGALTSNAITISSTASSNSTITGALIVQGGVGVGGSLYVGGPVYSGGNQLLYSVTPIAGAAITVTGVTTGNGNTSFTINNNGVQALTAGTDTAVSTSTGTVIIWNTSTLQSVTDRGSATSNAISITNTTGAGTTLTGALIVSGGIGIGGGAVFGGVVTATTFIGNLTGTATKLNLNGVSSSNTYPIALADTANSWVRYDSINSNGEFAYTPSGGAALGGLFIGNTTVSTNTTTGALRVSGGVGIQGNLYVGGTAVVGGATVWTTATLQNVSSLSNDAGYLTSATLGTYGVSAISAGTDTAVSASTGTVTVWNTSTLQSITNRGSVTTNAISITNTTSSTSTTTGALIVSGGVGIGGNLYINGEIVAQKLTIQLTTVTTTLVQTDDQIQTYNTTQSTGTTSGALVVSGGAGIGGNLYVGGTINGTATSATNVSGGTTGAIPYQVSPGVTGFIGTGTNGYVLTMVNNTATWAAAAAGAASTSSTATNITGGTTGSIVYQTAPGVSGFIGIGQNGYILTSNGTTATWVDPASVILDPTLAAIINANAQDMANPVFQNLYVGDPANPKLGVDPNGNTVLGGNLSVAGLTTITGALYVNSITPNANNTYDLGSASLIWNNVYTDAINAGSAGSPGTITGQWTLAGTSTFQATYADLAEYYTSDLSYEAGTVLVFGGIAEVTTTTQPVSRRVAGVVSEKAAYIMNVECPGIKACVALQGRVPCKVIGKVQKGDMLVTSSVPGYAIVNNDPPTGSIIGKAIVNKNDDGPGVIEVAIGRL